MSTKLKLMGVDVASFGNCFADDKTAKAITYEDPFKGSYKKLFFSLDGRIFSAASLSATLRTTLAVDARQEQRAVGDAAEGTAARQERRAAPARAMSSPPSPTMPRFARATTSAKPQICTAIRDNNLCSVDEVKSCTKAGSGCGGCLPLVTDLFKAEIKASGKKVSTALCEHFACTRQELFES